MIGTMYGQHALPKSYGGSYGRSFRKAGGVSATVIALVVLLILSGGLSLALLSAKSQVRDLHIQHESLAEEMTFTKNHLHHVEAQLASREIDYQHLAAEVHQHNQHHSVHEYETLRQEKHVLDQSLLAANDQVNKLKQELETTNALIEAYKQHLSDEVASHHQREENWLHIQEDWERLEKEMEDEINTLRAQLQIAKLQIPANVHEHHNKPQHMEREAEKHDPIYDHLPPAHIQQQQHQQQFVAAPVPVHQVASPVPVQQHNTNVAGGVASPTPVPVPASGQPVHQVPTQPVGGSAQPNAAVPQTAPVPPPAPATLAHDPHYDFHHETHDHETHDWHPNWRQDEYNQYFDHHNHYADYPGWVDDHSQAHAGGDHNAQQHAQQQTQQHAQQHAQQHTQQHAQQQTPQHDQQQQVIHANEWHHQDDSHHFQQGQQHAQQQAAPAQAPPAPQQQQHQQQQATGTWQHQQHHHDDLSMKLGLGHRRR